MPATRDEMIQPLSDAYGRVVDYLRVSVTDRCNFRCFYCMPRGGVAPIPHERILRYEEILSVIDAARRLGFRKFRITGGEPLVRRGITWLLNALSERGVDYSLTTNGLLLGRFAGELAAAGLKRINVGLDTLDADTFRRITGSGGLEEVFRGIDAAREEGIRSVKVNVVVMRGVNDGEMDDFMAWGRRERLDVRFIEFMPVYGEDLFVSLGPVVESMNSREGIEPSKESGAGPAKSFRHRDGAASIGFILSRTEPFCASCNRLRLTADGTLLPCLFSREGVHLCGPLRERKRIDGLIMGAVSAKPEGHNLNMRLSRYGMYALGG